MKAARKILIADSSTVTQHIMASTYIKAGYIIRTASTENELKNSLRMEAFDLVLLSQGFGENGPREIVKAIRLALPNCNIFLMATSLSVAETVELIKAGATDCFVKPFDTATLIKKTKQIFDTDEKEELFFKRNILHGEAGSNVLNEPKEEESNPAILEIERVVYSIRDYKVNVMITGEIGTGKTAYARKIHAESPMRNAPFVTFNCESEKIEDMEQLLFGEESPEGNTQAKGKLEQAGNGTLYIQELDKMPMLLQSKLVNVFQDGQFEVCRSGRIVSFNARVISTMTITPEQAMAAEKLRSDLYFLLSEVRMDLPPLRTCKDRLPCLTRRILAMLSQETGIPMPSINTSFLNALASYDWPGNTIELSNVVKRSFLLSQGKELTSSVLPISILQAFSKSVGSNESKENFLDLRDYLKDREMEIIFQTLDKFEGSRAKTAQYLRISERSLRYKIEEYTKQGGKK